jgi:hypothetical protein
VSRRHRRILTHRLTVLVMHLLKWRYQPEQQPPSWRRTIREQRRQLARLFERHPSLRPQLLALLTASYPDARQDALDETGLLDAALPQGCPWTPEQVLDAEFWPQE